MSSNLIIGGRTVSQVSWFGLSDSDKSHLFFVVNDDRMRVLKMEYVGQAPSPFIFEFKITHQYDPRMDRFRKFVNPQFIEVGYSWFNKRALFIDVTDDMAMQRMRL